MKKSQMLAFCLNLTGKCLDLLVAMESFRQKSLSFSHYSPAFFKSLTCCCLLRSWNMRQNSLLFVESILWGFWLSGHIHLILVPPTSDSRLDPMLRQIRLPGKIIKLFHHRFFHHTLRHEGHSHVRVVSRRFLTLRSDFNWSFAPQHGWEVGLINLIVVAHEERIVGVLRLAKLEISRSRLPPVRLLVVKNAREVSMPDWILLNSAHVGFVSGCPSEMIQSHWSPLICLKRQMRLVAWIWLPSLLPMVRNFLLDLILHL